ncbi:MAG: 2-oxoacid:acceptor oxidoreductase subunit alpha [Erysipelotrichales bacterium]|nr:2-oxoacid:acceptor oxidoreductase subunit alpha [Erysipelotrichales bacterium]MBQ5542283.1 2-oxoacid:acceptor oxidoreductase subunit alpha [Erysipelotrichales bacterium]
MGKIVLMQGNEACVEGAIAAGMRFYAGYPITPSTEIAERCAVRLPQEGGKFIQMEDEIGSIACAIGASAAGVKAMTATSGPGFSLKQENLGYACIAELPIVVVDVQRQGPSTGMPTSPSQGDVMMARWGTHGDHPIIVLSPSTVKECYGLTIRAFNLSERYRVPVIFLMDEIVGHLREGMELPDPEDIEIKNRPSVEYPDHKRLPYHMKKGQLVAKMAPVGKGQRYNITGLTHDESGFPTNSNAEAKKLMDRLMGKITQNYDKIVEVDQINMEDAEVAIFCYGGTYRAALTAMEELRKKGVKCGIFRPITIWPFPERELVKAASGLKRIIVAEHNYGQMVLEVERVVKNACEIKFVGKYDGTVITPEEIMEKAVD